MDATNVFTCQYPHLFGPNAWLVYCSRAGSDLPLRRHCWWHMGSVNPRVTVNRNARGKTPSCEISLSSEVSDVSSSPAPCSACCADENGHVAELMDAVPLRRPVVLPSFAVRDPNCICPRQFSRSLVLTYYCHLPPFSFLSLWWGAATGRPQAAGHASLARWRQDAPDCQSRTFPTLEWRSQSGQGPHQGMGSGLLCPSAPKRGRLVPGCAVQCEQCPASAHQRDLCTPASRKP